MKPQRAAQRLCPTQVPVSPVVTRQQPHPLPRLLGSRAPGSEGSALPRGDAPQDPKRVPIPQPRVLVNRRPPSLTRAPGGPTADHAPCIFARPAPAPRAPRPGPTAPVPGRPHSPSCGAASLPLLPPDGSRAAPSRASALAPGRAANRPAAATSSRSRRWLTEKFLRAWAQSPGPSAGGGGGGPGPSAGLSRAKAAAALSMPASGPGGAGGGLGRGSQEASRARVGASAPAAPRSAQLPPPPGSAARPALTSGKQTFRPPLLSHGRWLESRWCTRCAGHTPLLEANLALRPLLRPLLPARLARPHPGCWRWGRGRGVLPSPSPPTF